MRPARAPRSGPDAISGTRTGAQNQFIANRPYHSDRITRVSPSISPDNTAHAVLKIIRELAANALRHGKASSLKIAGTVEDGKLFFSVRDNGCGFDPDLAPGISEGHFGLQGIAERLERLNGEMKIESSPGKGAKVSVTLPIPRSGE